MSYKEKRTGYNKLWYGILISPGKILRHRRDNTPRLFYISDEAHAYIQRRKPNTWQVYPLRLQADRPDAKEGGRVSNPAG